LRAAYGCLGRSRIGNDPQAAAVSSGILAAQNRFCEAAGWASPIPRTDGMNMASEQAYGHVGRTRGMENHDHDLIHELSRRLDCLWRYDQYLENADDRPELQEFWRSVKSQEQRNIDQLKTLIKKHVQSNCF
jgi:hypothetical protein